VAPCFNLLTKMLSPWQRTAAGIRLSTASPGPPSTQLVPPSVYIMVTQRLQRYQCHRFWKVQRRLASSDQTRSMKQGISDQVRDIQDKKRGRDNPPPLFSIPTAFPDPVVLTVTFLMLPWLKLPAEQRIPSRMDT